MVRDADGQWTLPQFITLTGGSVGWQAGIQGTDVVLVFTTRKGVEGLLKGKFTVGVDAAATAGPVERNAAAATDTKLKAEIFSYSRSRGLFLGICSTARFWKLTKMLPPPSTARPNPRASNSSRNQRPNSRGFLVELTTTGAPLPAPGIPVAPR